jgi:hypothetical protein
MEKAIIDALIVGGPALVSGWIGFYLGSYLKKKGENQAIHEDINKLVDQVAAVTQTTKEIEAKISSEMWDRQKNWEMKREVVFESMKRVVQADNALLSFSMILKVGPTDGDDWIQTIHEQTVKWRDASNALDESRSLITVVCSEETRKAMEHFGMLTNQIAGGISQKNAQAYPNSSKALAEALFLVRVALRKELGIETVASLPASASAK